MPTGLRTVLFVTLSMVGPAGAQEGDAPPAGPGQPPPPDPAQRRAAVQQLLQVIKNEPTVKDVQRWTVEHYKLEPSRINRMASASNWKGVVPEIEVSLENGVGHNFSNSVDGLFPTLPSTTLNPEGYKEKVSASNDQFTWRVRGVWNLDRMIFNAESLDVKSLHSIQENLVREVTTLYFARRRLLASLFLSPPNDDEELYYELTRMDELTSTIDVMTGGRFEKKAWKWDDEGEGAGKGKGKGKAKKEEGE